MFRLIARVLVTAIVCTLPAVAFAQGGASGSIIGIVTDQNGMPLKGIKISAKSDTNIGGSKVTYTTDEGTFTMMGLAPGIFEVSASAPKMKTFVVKQVKVGVNAAAEVNALMEVETATEEVKIVEKAPIVSTTTANVKEVWDEEFIDQIPVDNKTSAEEIIGRGVPGAENVDTRNFKVRGGNANQNEMQVEGFRLNGQRTTVRSLAAMEIQTAGYGADNASTPGGVVNMVTKSGSNKYEFDVNGFYEDSNLTFFQQPDEREQSHQYFVVLNPSISGPIIKDRLWFFVNIEARRQLKANGGDPQGQFPDIPQQQYGNVRGTAKFTWQVTPRNKLISFSSYDYRHDKYMKQEYSSYYERDAQNREDERNWFTGLIWESLLADNVFFKSQAGFQQFNKQAGPQMCAERPDVCDHIPSIKQSFPRAVTLQNFNEREQTVKNAFQFINTLEWFPSSRALGQHSVKLRNDFYSESEETAEGVPGDKVIYYNGTINDRAEFFFANDPRLETGRFGYFIRNASAWKNVTSLQDQMRLTRYFTLTPGVGMTTARATSFIGDSPVDGMAFTPHVSAAWDATHDGRTVLRGSFNNYVDVNALTIARHMVGTQVKQSCRWNETTQAYDNTCTFSGGSLRRTIGLPCGPSGFDAAGEPCREKLRIPRTWEYTVGGEREIVQGVGLGADVVYRLYTRPYEVFETNRIWNAAGNALDPDGGFRNGRSETIEDLQTSDKIKRRYLGVTAALHKREGALKMSAAYTWSRLEGNSDVGTIPSRDFYFLYGPLDGDRRHNLRVNLTYQWTKWLSNGLFWDYRTGRPVNRRFRNDVTGGSDDYRARVGINPGADLNSPYDDREVRTADIMQFNLQGRVNLRPLTGANGEIYVDMLNVLGLRTQTGVSSESDGPNWGLPSGRMPAMKARLGFRYRY